VARIGVENLVKAWGTDFRAVDDVSFEIGSAEFVALLGPSGCGKSTTLRLIAGLEQATSGRILIDGRDVAREPPSHRNLSLVFQSYALFPHLNAADNITFGLSVRGVPRAERQRRLERTADLLGLSSLLERKPSQLSGGQQQRVALGRALISETPICLLDEPLSNLDAKLRAEMRNEIRTLQQRLGITMIFVTHDQTEAMSMADRVILMRNGKVEQSGSPDELYEKPASTFVAGFIGTPPMNLLAARQEGGRLRAAETEEAGQGLILGVRPEHIVIADGGQPATVDGSEYFGADTVVGCRIGSQRLAVRVPGRPGLAPGAVVGIAWPDHAAHLFDARSGRRRDDK
jgi:sn-glycerol 3-phosphate transport system ATP-binding protein